MLTTNAQWVAAQFDERRFHVDEVPAWGIHGLVEVRRHQEAVMRAWYAALLDIPLTRTVTVTDYGCGPQSLLLDRQGDAECYAVDPLRFTDEDEATYANAGIKRAYVPAEKYVGPVTEEGWMYNCLQHTYDWNASLINACQHTARTFRLFEWVDVPTDTLHLHTLRTDELCAVLSEQGFKSVKQGTGTFAISNSYASNFLAGVWNRA